MRTATIFLAVASAFGQAAAPARPAAPPAGITAGAKAFRSHCAPCHGARGEGGRGPNLASGVFFHGSTDADLFQNIATGIPGTAMPSLFFPPEGISQLVAYVRSLSQTTGRQPPPGDPARGARLFRDQQCVGCHLVRGEGGFRGPDLSVIGSQRSPEYLRRAITDPNSETAPEYRVARIALANGASYSGFVLNEDTHAVQLLDFSKGLTSLSRRDFRRFDLDSSPLMPSYKT
jgi:putative heme-binding domain-containing protein